MFLALRELRFAKGRFALIATVVALITVLVVLLSGLTAGLAQGSTSAITSLSTDGVAFSRPTPGETVSYEQSDLSPDTAAKASRQPGVTAASLLRLTTSRVAIGDDPHMATLFSIDPGAYGAPAALHAGSVVVSSQLASSARLGVGDPVTVAGRSLSVAAVCGQCSFNHLPVVWVAAADLPQQPGTSSVMLLKTDHRFEHAAFDRALGVQTTSKDASLSAIGSYTAEHGSLTMIQGMLIAISALVIGAFFTVWTMARTADLAVLKAIGARTRDLLVDALAQALIVLVVGGGAGALVAAGVGLLARQNLPFVVDASTTMLPLALLVCVGLLGAAVALRRVTSVDPITALGATR